MLQMFSFDSIVITAADEAQATCFRIQATPFEGVLARRILVVPDPGGKRVGTLGSTVNVLKRVPCGGRTLICHCGGFSKRLPAYAASGKVFAPVARAATGVTTLFEKIVRDMAALELPRTGALVVCGDVAPDFDFKSCDFSRQGVTGVAYLDTLARGSRHGVYVPAAVSSKPPCLAAVKNFLQKPSPAESKRTGAAVRGKVAVDTGIMWLDAPTCAKLARSKWKEGDLYSDFTAALLEGFAAFHVNVVRTCDFFHIGSSRELLDLLGKGREWVDGCGVSRSEMKLAGENIVTNVPADYGKKIALGRGECLLCLPVGKDGWAEVRYNVKDNFKEDGKWETLGMGKLMKRVNYARLAAHRADGDAFAAAARDLLGQTLDRPLSVDEETVGAPYTETLNNGVLTLSPSRLETYADCPYSYHLHYTLKLQEERTGEWKNTERGEVIHLILERFLRKMKDENRFDGGAPIEDAEIASLVSGILGEYCENVCGGREMQPRIRRLLRQTESLAVLLLKDMRDEFGTGKFRPAFFELPVGSTGAEEDLPDGVRLPAVALPRDSDEKQLCIRGKIDRVDCYRDGEDLYLRVVDYKTYQKTLSLEDLKSGHNLQMPLYLCALCEEENTDAAKRLCPSPIARRIPAGTVYYIAKQTAPLNRSGMSAAEMEKKICDRIERNGFTSSDPKVLEAIDPTASGRFYQKRGLMSEEEMREMLELSSEKALELARDLRSGRADATPLRDGKNDSCRYCHMEQICRRCGRNEAGEGEEP